MFFFFQAEDGIRDYKVTGVQTCALPISVALALPLTWIAIDPSGHPAAQGPTTISVIDVSGDLSSTRVIIDRKSTRLNSSHLVISYAVFCLKKKKATQLRYCRTR